MATAGREILEQRRPAVTSRERRWLLTAASSSGGGSGRPELGQLTSAQMALPGMACLATAHHDKRWCEADDDGDACRGASRGCVLPIGNSPELGFGRVSRGRWWSNGSWRWLGVRECGGEAVRTVKEEGEGGVGSSSFFQPTQRIDSRASYSSVCPTKVMLESLFLEIDRDNAPSLEDFDEVMDHGCKLRHQVCFRLF
ncbi:hypothetical protein Droror1_Dr00002411 [Drosera rotundifolia]